jgi:hypothetical protein
LSVIKKIGRLNSLFFSMSADGIDLGITWTCWYHFKWNGKSNSLSLIVSKSPTLWTLKGSIITVSHKLILRDFSNFSKALIKILKSTASIFGVTIISRLRYYSNFIFQNSYHNFVLLYPYFLISQIIQHMTYSQLACLFSNQRQNIFFPFKFFSDLLLM